MVEMQLYINIVLITFVLLAILLLQVVIGSVKLNTLNLEFRFQPNSIHCTPQLISTSIKPRLASTLITSPSSLALYSLRKTPLIYLSLVMSPECSTYIIVIIHSDTNCHLLRRQPSYPEISYSLRTICSSN